MNRLYNIISLAILIFLFKEYNTEYSYIEINNQNSWLISSIFLVFYFFLMEFLNQKKINSLVLIYSHLVLTPSLALFISGSGSIEVLTYCFISVILIMFFSNNSETEKTKYFLSSNLLLIISVIFIFFNSLILETEFDFNLFLLETVYDTRDFVKDLHNPFTLYFGSFFSKFIIPILLTIFIYKKKYFQILLCIVLLLWYFLSTSLKTVLFTPVVIFFFYFFRKYRTKNIINLFFLILIISSLIGYYYFPIDLLGRRFFYIPATLTEVYINFFRDNQLYLSYAWYNPFVEYNYMYPPQYLISGEFWADEYTSANNGLVSSGFMNFGLFGIVIYSIILGKIFKIFSKQYIRSYLGVMFLFVFVFSTSFFVTSLLSHGIILFALFKSYYEVRSSK